MKTIGILNGPNLDRLGKREPEVYGSETLADLEERLKAKATDLDYEIAFFQSNHEGELIDKLAEWVDSGVSAVVLNGAGLTHTSVALRDAIAASDLPVVEVHISHIYQREPFRHTSLTAPVCKGVISGLGFYGYEAAMEFLAKR
ncbi:type II 3-dehydroquinate dehydratase [Rubellicoccus peritrichatus]|uniref:3-dehydroquinate dehydratase n=1 Tax=Rubellicoccus peritrichatus TaxID=3080537 RepID=A0AAQ3QWR9_9BACT|nr:type II 3-dehydroquinate dehydratase [Puniceicoccus sp. CR14]WOO43023.1 type II 3-dehydroquinate dehydratase [Puniceicoccus sp. CR14]